MLPRQILTLEDLLDLDFKKFERETNVKLKSVLSNMTEPSAKKSAQKSVDKTGDKSRSRTKSKAKKDFISGVNKNKKASDYHFNISNPRKTFTPEKDQKKDKQSKTWATLAIKKEMFMNLNIDGIQQKSGKSRAK